MERLALITLQKLSLENPILVGLGLLLIALAFRLLDIFALRLDERLGEIILSKSLGFILVVLFALWLLMGNIINSFMEEGLFRGVMIRLFGRALSLSQANWLQSFLFASWHRSTLGRIDRVF